MPKFRCKTCGKEAYVKPSHLERGWRIYCSKKCQNEGLKKGKLFPCHTCGKEIYKSVQIQARSTSGKFFCGKSCQTLWRNSIYIEEKHSNWKGGTASYRNILSRTDAVRICGRCKNEDTRVLIAHHKDRNRQNNTVSNLIWLCHNCHYLVHHYKTEAKNFMVPIA